MVHNDSNLTVHECRLNDKIPRHFKIITSLAAGAIAGSISKTVIAPLDYSKIHFQVSGVERYSSQAVFEYLKQSVREVGIRGLWRGNSATLVRVAPYAAINFATHEQWKNVLYPAESYVEGDESSGLSGRHLPPFRRFAAGVLSGLTATTITYPLDLAKARLSVTHNYTYSGLLDVFRKIYYSKGWVGFYRGYVPTALGVMPYVGAMFFTYDTLKKVYSDRMDGESPPALYQLFFGGVSGMLGQISCYPVDIARRRMQTSAVTGMDHVYTSVLKTLIYVYRTEGFIHGWYKGISLNWIKGPIAAAITFATFEAIQMELRQFEIFQTCETTKGS